LYQRNQDLAAQQEQQVQFHDQPAEEFVP